MYQGCCISTKGLAKLSPWSTLAPVLLGTPCVSVPQPYLSPCSQQPFVTSRTNCFQCPSSPLPHSPPICTLHEGPTFFLRVGSPFTSNSCGTQSSIFALFYLRHGGSLVLYHSQLYWITTPLTPPSYKK
jgi:hypothetical protein